MNTYRCRLTDDMDHTDEDAKSITAASPEIAACSYVEQYDANAVEYPSEREVIVISPDGSRQTLTVCQEAVPQYWVPRQRTKT